MLSQSEVKQKTTRITVNFSEQAAAWLVEEAERRASSIADLVRRIVDETRGAYVVPPDRRSGIYNKASNERGSKPEQSREQGNISI